MVSNLSILFMAVAGIISIALPVVLFLFWRRKHRLRIVPALIGAAAFIIFAMVLEQLMHLAVLRPDADGTIALLSDNPALYVLYGIFAAGIFEETARFIAFKLLKKKHDGAGTALSYGIGHGGIEAVIVLGLTSVNNIALSAMINSGSAELPSFAGGTAETMAVLVETSPFLFLVGALERVFAVSIHVSLSVFVWFAAMRKSKFWLYPVAITLHATANLSAALMHTGVLDSILLVEVLVGITSLLIALLAVYLYRKLGRNDEGAPISKELLEITSNSA